MGVPMETALEATEEWVAGGPRKKREEEAVPATAGVRSTTPEAREKTEAELVAQNNAAMAELARRMPGGLGV